MEFEKIYALGEGLHQRNIGALVSEAKTLVQENIGVELGFRVAGQKEYENPTKFFPMMRAFTGVMKRDPVQVCVRGDLPPDALEALADRLGCVLGRTYQNVDRMDAMARLDSELGLDKKF